VEVHRSAAQVRARSRAPLAAWVPAGIFVVALLLAGAAFYAGFVVSGSAGETAGLAHGAVAMVVLVLAVWVLILSRLIVVASPNELAVLSGRPHRNPDGTTSGFRIVRGGRALRIPLVERLDTLDLGNHPITLEIRRCHAKGGALVTVEAVANVKIAGELPGAARAIERFLGRNREDVAQVARQTLEGALRGVVAELTVDELRDNLLHAADRAQQEVDHDFSRPSLENDTLRITKVEAG
jgi:flotillin